MEKFKCPHCKKEIELSEVTKKQANLLAAQEIQKFKDSHKGDVETAKQEAAKKAKEDQKKLSDKEQKDKDLKIKQLEENKKKDIDAATKKAKRTMTLARSRWKGLRATGRFRWSSRRCGRNRIISTRTGRLP